MYFSHHEQCQYNLLPTNRTLKSRLYILAQAFFACVAKTSLFFYKCFQTANTCFFSILSWLHRGFKSSIFLTWTSLSPLTKWFQSCRRALSPPPTATPFTSLTLTMLSEPVFSLPRSTFIRWTASTPARRSLSWKCFEKHFPLF